MSAKETPWLVIYDEPRFGGDGTFLTEGDGEDDDLWSSDRERARVMTSAEAEAALEDVDCDELLRDRLHIVPASRFGLPMKGKVSTT